MKNTTNAKQNLRPNKKYAINMLNKTISFFHLHVYNFFG